MTFELNLGIVFSGFLGVLVGALVSYAVTRYREWLAVKQKFAHLLFEIAEELDYSKKSVEEILRPRFIDLWILGRDVANLSLTFDSSSIIEKTDLLCGSMRGIMRDDGASPASHSFPLPENAKRHADDLLRLLGYR